jgi:hypothetical protein
MGSEFSRRSRRARAPLANTLVGGPGRKAGRRRDFGLGDRKAVNEHEGKHRRAWPF